MLKKYTWMTLAVLALTVAATAAETQACFFRRCGCGGGRRRCCDTTSVYTGHLC